MRVKKMISSRIFAITLLFTGFTANTHANVNCAQDCSKEQACRFAFKRQQCARDCGFDVTLCTSQSKRSPQSTALSSTTIGNQYSSEGVVIAPEGSEGGTAIGPGPSQATARHTVSPPPRRRGALPPRPRNLPPSPPSAAQRSASTSQTEETIGNNLSAPPSVAEATGSALMYPVDLAGADRPPPAVPIAPLSADTNHFFKEFTSDILTVGASLKCLTKSITVGPEQFKKSIPGKVVSGLKTLTQKKQHFTPYRNYDEYKKDLGQYFESMINLNIIEAFQQWNRNSMKAQEEFQGLITRGIRFTEGVAKKIPGYTPSTVDTAGADMMGPYLQALPDKQLSDLNGCIQENKDKAYNPTLRNFYGYFLAKIAKEENIRKDPSLGKRGRRAKKAKK